ncbi:MAG: sigma-70 family RNA polymerase sigma factor [Actinobacteria bacterium]|nr:sigma-70 family RNA polymerase sigma factor [Actinomycetota bacterium]
MANLEDPKAFGDDPLEQLLDEESDEEFGLPEFREHFADSLTPAVLKDWTAKDFASIYVRFRPHLERHARRYLQNPSQVEEVVQDAFLYLMTSLPELDSELGVLKFLKWKTRLLALDVIRANSRATMAPIDDQPEFASNDPEVSQDLERAEDAAIVSMALAKLQPRHREALIATLYEEKPQEVVAAQMGLSENAFRQLLFRARASFKKALIGEAETAGLSMSQILSIAARKAAAESGKYISAAGAFLLVLAISIGVLPNLSPTVSDQQISAPEPSISAPTETQEPIAPAEETQISEPAATSTEVLQAETVVMSATVNTTTQVSNETDGSLLSEQEVMVATLKPLLGAKTLAALASDAEGRIVSSSTGEVSVLNSSGLKANVVYDLNTENGIQSAWFEFKVGDAVFYALPKTWIASKSVDSQGRTVLMLGATDLVVGNADGKLGNVVIENSVLGNGKIRLEIILDDKASPITSSLTIKSNY